MTSMPLGVNARVFFQSVHASRAVMGLTVLHMQGCPPVDLLIRTSGEHRLSDFLLWQSNYAQLVFSDTLWPDYSFWNLLQALVQYQRSYPELQKLKAASQQALVSQCNILSQHGPAGVNPLAGLEVAADTLDGPGIDGKTQANSQSVDGARNVTDADTSDSSASSESRPASPDDSPVRPARHMTCVERQGLAPTPSLQQDISMHADHDNCQECNIEQNKQMQSGELILGSSSPDERVVNHAGRVLLHAAADCRTSLSPHLIERRPRKASMD